MRLSNPKKRKSRNLRLEIFGIPPLSTKDIPTRRAAREMEDYLKDVARGSPLVSDALMSVNRNAVIKALTNVREKRGPIPDKAIFEMVKTMEHNPGNYVDDPKRLLEDTIGRHIAQHAENREKLIGALANHENVFRIMTDVEERHFRIQLILKRLSHRGSVVQWLRRRFHRAKIVSSILTGPMDDFMKRHSGFQKRFEKGDRQVLRQLKKATDKRMFSINNIFRKIFGMSALEPLFMQKTKGGVIFFLHNNDYKRVTKPRWEFQESHGRIESEAVKPRKLKNKVLIINVDDVPYDETVPEVVEHEKLHLKGAYSKPREPEFHEALKEYLKKEAIKTVLERGSGLMYWMDLREPAEHHIDYLTIGKRQIRPSKLRNVIQNRIAAKRLDRKERIADELKGEYMDTIVQIADEVNYASAYGIPKEEVAEIISTSKWEDIVKNLYRFIEAKKPKK